MKILMVEDDELTAQTLKILLSSYNFAVDVATDGEAGWAMVEAFEYDLLLLDIFLPKLNGIKLCQQLRHHGYQMPILLLTGQDGFHEKAVALNAGADDYVVKPFDAEELIARVRALLRRGSSVAQPVLKWGNLCLESSSHTAAYNTHPLTLTPKEFAILELLLRYQQRLWSTDAMLEHVWGSEDVPTEDAVRVHIKTLRQKFKSVGAPVDLIETVYGVGYRLRSLTPEVKNETNAA
jgi:DNA-binding response OmpR family regulator